MSWRPGQQVSFYTPTGTRIQGTVVMAENNRYIVRPGASVDAQTLLNDALKQVESNSIRAWVTSAHNHPLWLKIAQMYIDQGRADPALLCTDIVATAIGLR